jgi:hypothetical protein
MLVAAVSTPNFDLFEFCPGFLLGQHFRDLTLYVRTPLGIFARKPAAARAPETAKPSTICYFYNP